MIIVVVSSAVASMSEPDKATAYAYLQQCASKAGLAGNVAMVWRNSDSTASYYAPQPWHAFLTTVSWPVVAANVNRRLTCG
jgi:hypothetical protein